MKSSFITVLLLLGFSASNAQNKISISFNQNFSTFRFVDSEGNKEDMDYSMNFGYGLSFQRIFAEHFFVEGQLVYNNKGANYIVDSQKLDWAFQYLNPGINAGYKFTFARISPHAGAGLYYGRLLKAEQYIGTVYYNLMDSENIKKNDFGVNVFAGIEYEYSDNGTVFLRFNESIGLLQLEESGEADQKMFNRTTSIQLGLFFTIM